MDNSNTPGNCDKDHKHNKMAIKFGGGGIGAVLLLGGVLATASLASAFAARRKGRSSGKDRRSVHRNPPPQKDEASNDAVSHVSTQSLVLDVEMNGVSGDGFVIVDCKLLVDNYQSKMPGDEQQREGDASDDSSKEMENRERLCVEEVPKQEENTEIVEVEDKGVDEERESGLKEDVEVKLEREEVEGFRRGDEGPTSEKRCVEVEERESGLTEDMEVKLVREEVGGFGSGDEEMMSEKKCLDHDQERESGLIEEDQEALNDEKLVKKQDKCEEKQGNQEENALMLHQTLDEITNVEAEFDAKENVEKEVDVSTETIAEVIDKEKGGMDLETSEEEEESSLGSGNSSSESNSEAVWPAESAKLKLVDYKIGELDDQTGIKKKTFINKYYKVEMEMDHRTNSGRRRVAIAMLSLLSSLSCSWFLGLSFAKLCLLVFLAMVLSELHGY